jgi:predicted ATP-grasp superfamily ATP-dependent carboligase
MNSKKILITDAYRGSALSIIRSLGRKGYTVYAADSEKKSVGFYSRYVSKQIVYPSPELYANRFQQFMLETVKREGIDLIIPVTDLTIYPLLKMRKEFEAVSRLAIPDDEQLAIVSDKYRTMCLAQEWDVPVPKTILVNTAREALEHAKELQWPIVLKPQISKLLNSDHRIKSLHVTYANSESELKCAMQELEGVCSVLLQSFYAGSGVGIELLAHEGTLLAVFEHKRRREIPVSGGASSYRESVALEPELVDYASRMIKALSWTGLAMVEFKSGIHGAKLMEINGRVWGSLPLAVKSGVDFPALLASCYLDRIPSPPSNLNTNYRLGVRSRDIHKDFLWIASVLLQKRDFPFLEIPKRQKAIKAILGYMNPKRKFDLFSWDDPMPAVYGIPQIVWKLGKKVKKI